MYTKMITMKGPNGQQVPAMMIRMRCEKCERDVRFMVPYDTPIAALPDITKMVFRCACRRHIPTIKNMEKSLKSINGVPFRQLQGMQQLFETYPGEEKLN